MQQRKLLTFSVLLLAIAASDAQARSRRPRPSTPSAPSTPPANSPAGDDVGGLSRPRTLKVMGWNVQNLFDTIDNPDTSDEEFTPNGSQHWTESVIRDKLKNLGEVIKSQKPDILAVTEIENQSMLDRLVREGLAGGTYRTVIAGPSDDARGIRNGVVSRFPTVSWKSHRVWKDSWRSAPNGPVQKTRDILEVTLQTDVPGPTGQVTVLVNHWPSRGGGPIREVYRREAAQLEVQITEEIQRANPGRLVISMGDFNDELRDTPFGEMRMVNSPSDLSTGGPGSFYALDSELEALPPAQRGTFYFHAGHEWNNLDHLLISMGADLAKEQVQGFHYVRSSVSVVRSRFLENNQYPQGCEIFTPRGQRPAPPRTTCQNGASDHFGLAATFEYR